MRGYEKEIGLIGIVVITLFALYCGASESIVRYLVTALLVTLGVEETMSIRNKRNDDS